MSNTLEIIKKEVQTIPTEVSITNTAQMAEATAMLSLANKQNDAIKVEKDKVMRPLLDAVAAERNRWKPLETKLAGIISSLRTEMSRYQTAEKKKADEEKAKIANRVGSGKGKLKLTTAVKKQAEIVTPDDIVETDAGTAAFVTDYEITLDDYTKVPAEYLKIEVKKAEVKKAAKAGKTIPGLTIKEIQVPRNYR